MDNQTKYSLTAPIGVTVAPKGDLSERELRDFAAQLLADADSSDVWKEKLEKDPIAEVVDWLENAGWGVKQS